VSDTEISKIHSSGSDNQDLSGLQPKETGKGLSTNDLTTTLKANYTGSPTQQAWTAFQKARSALTFGPL